MNSPVPGHVAIPKLIFRYAELLDSGDFAGVGELFAHAVIEVDEPEARPRTK